MKLNDVLTLARAGYSAQQIAQFAQLEKQTPAPAPEPAGAPAHAPAPAPAPAPVPAPAPHSFDDVHSFNDIYQMIAGIRDDIHAGNLLSASQAGAAEPTADDIIANIINPKNEGGKN